MTEKKPIELTHPESDATVETHEPETYLSQGWEKAGRKPAESDK